MCDVLRVTLHVIWLSNSRFCCFNFHCSDVTRTPCRLNSSVSTLFVQLSYKWYQFSASLAICHWCLWGESTDHRWNFLRRTGDTESVFILSHHHVTQSLMCPTWTLSGFQMSTAKQWTWVFHQYYSWEIQFWSFKKICKPIQINNWVSRKYHWSVGKLPSARNIARKVFYSQQCLKLDLEPLKTHIFERRKSYIFISWMRRRKRVINIFTIMHD